MTPTQAGGCSPGNRDAVIEATRGAVRAAITALARVRDWRRSRTARDALDVYYGTTNDTERQVAADRVVVMLERIIPQLQRPLVDCIEPGHWAYSRVCPSGTIADSQGVTIIQIPTFCMPQFTNLTNPDARVGTVLHEFSHNLCGTVDYGAYNVADTCAPTGDTIALTRTQHLRHADSFSCFAIVLAVQSPR